MAGAGGNQPIGGLERIEHVVVLMMENRSFDHMLGFLSLHEGRHEIDGLRGDESNEYAGTTYPVHHLDRTQYPKPLDPCHGAACVAQQISGEMGGFVANFVETNRPDPAHAGLVMGYYDAGDLPVYAHLADEFAVCDRWFSSLPGSTWPNRLYSLTGRCDGSADNHPGPPIYDLPTFARQLDAHGVSWRWYSHDPATLRLADGHYRLTHHDHFAFFDRRKVSILTDIVEGALLEEGSCFLDDAREGKLPSVSWIDPNFVDLSFFETSSNDDHPPSDVHAGQQLVLQVYRALAESPLWDRTLLVITYDEHGGFHDHVVPPEAADDDPRFRRYGVRVPALVVSPWVEPRAVSHELFDHTSLIKTILARFCAGPDGALPDMGARVAAANHLGALLTRSEPRSDHAQSHGLQGLVERFHEHRIEALLRRLLHPNEPPEPPQQLDELKSGIAAAARELRRQGLPAAHP